MRSETTMTLSCDKVGRDVVVVSWPDQAEERDRLDLAAVPRLWLVDAGAAPPIATSCLEDWIRLPADDADLRARLASLSHHAALHPTRPELDEHGLLTHRGVVVRLSPVERRLAKPLIADFGEAVSESDMLGTGCLDGCNEQNLRVHVSRLRRRVAPIGLCITRIRGFGYVLSPGQDDTRSESLTAGARGHRTATDVDTGGELERRHDRLVAW